MQTKCNKLAAGVFAGILWGNVASAHPGHAPTDLAAQLSFPFAGADHFLVFVAVTAGLLLLLRGAARFRAQDKRRVRPQ